MKKGIVVVFKASNFYIVLLSCEYSIPLSYFMFTYFASELVCPRNGIAYSFFAVATQKNYHQLYHNIISKHSKMIECSKWICKSGICCLIFKDNRKIFVSPSHHNCIWTENHHDGECFASSNKRSNDSHWPPKTNVAHTCIICTLTQKPTFNNTIISSIKCCCEKHYRCTCYGPLEWCCCKALLHRLNILKKFLAIRLVLLLIA